MNSNNFLLTAKPLPSKAEALQRIKKGVRMLHRLHRLETHGNTFS